MRKNMYHLVLPVVLTLIALVRMHGWADEARIRAATATVDAVRITQADREPGNWLTHGRTYAEQRYSPLRQIHADNVGQLGLAWFYDTHTSRGLEGTPLAVDGVLYVTGPWSVVYAIDGRTGTRLWEYDPQVPKRRGQYACCDVVNRGAALWQGKVYVGTIDGRLVALDAATGQVVWDTLTVDPGKPYTITGAPRVVRMVSSMSSIGPRESCSRHSPTSKSPGPMGST